MKNLKKLPRKGLLSFVLVLSLIFGISASPAFAAHDDSSSSSNSIAGQQDASSADSAALPEGSEPGGGPSGEGAVTDPDDVATDDSPSEPEGEGGLGEFLSNAGNAFVSEFSAMLNNSTTYFGRTSSSNPSKVYEKVKYEGEKQWFNQQNDKVQNPADGTDWNVKVKLVGFVDWNKGSDAANLEESKSMATVNNEPVAHDKNGIISGDLNGDGVVDDCDKYFDRNGNGAIDNDEANVHNTITLPYFELEKTIDSSTWKYEFAALDRYFYEYERVPVLDESGAVVKDEHGNPKPLLPTFQFKLDDNDEPTKHPIKYVVEEVYESDDYEKTVGEEGNGDPATSPYVDGAVSGTTYNKIVNLLNRYLGDTEIRNEQLTYEGTKYWMGVSEGESLPEEVTLELRGTIGNGDAQSEVFEKLESLYDKNDDGSVNWNSPKSDLNGDGATDDRDRYFDLNGDGIIDVGDESEDKVDGKLVPIGLPVVYQSATAKADNGWAYEFDPVNETFYDFDIVEHSVPTGEGDETKPVKTFVPKTTPDANGYPRYTSMSYTYTVTELPLPEEFAGFHTLIGEPSNNDNTVGVNVYNYKLDKSGKLKIVKKFNEYIYVDGYTDKNGQWKLGENNSRIAVFHIVGKMTEASTGKDIVVYDGYASCEFKAKGDDEVVVADLPVGAQYTIEEVGYSGCGYVLKSIEPSKFVLEPAQGDDPEMLTVNIVNEGTKTETPNMGWINEYSPKEGGGYDVVQINRTEKLQ